MNFCWPSRGNLRSGLEMPTSACSRSRLGSVSRKFSEALKHVLRHCLFALSQCVAELAVEEVEVLRFDHVETGGIDGAEEFNDVFIT